MASSNLEVEAISQDFTIPDNLKPFYPIFCRGMKAAHEATLVSHPDFPRDYTIGELSDLQGHSLLEDTKKMDEVLRLQAVQGGEEGLRSMFHFAVVEMKKYFTTLYWIPKLRAYCVRAKCYGSLGKLLSTMENPCLLVPVCSASDLNRFKALPFRYRFFGGALDLVQTFPEEALVSLPEDKMVVKIEKFEAEMAARQEFKKADFDPLKALPDAPKKDFAPNKIDYLGVRTIEDFKRDIYNQAHERSFFQAYSSYWPNGCEHSRKHNVPCYRDHKIIPYPCAFCVFTRNPTCSAPADWKGAVRHLEADRKSFNQIAQHIHTLLKLQAKLDKEGDVDPEDLERVAKDLFEDLKRVSWRYEYVEVAARELSNYKETTFHKVLDKNLENKLTQYFARPMKRKASAMDE